MENETKVNMYLVKILVILILSCLYSCISAHHPSTSVKMCQKYADEGDDFFSYSDYENAVIKYELAADCFRQNLDSNEVMAVLSNMIVAYKRMNHYLKAVEKEEELVEIAHQDDPFALMILAKSYFRTGEYMKALCSYENALVSAKENPVLIGIIQGNIANVRLELGDYFTAIALYKKALETVTDTKQFAAFLGNLGAAYMSIGDYHTASEHYRKALQLAKEQNDPKMEAAFLVNLGNVYFKADRLSEKSLNTIINYYQSALRIAKEIGDDSLIKTASVNIGMVCIIQNNITEAEKYLNDADFLRQGILYLHKDPPEYEKAIEMIRAHLPEVEQSMDTDSIFGCYMTLALALEKANRLSEASDYFRALINRIEDEREMISESQKVHFFEAKPYFIWNRLAPYEGMIRINRGDEAFYYAEAIKSRCFMEKAAKKYQIGISTKQVNIPFSIQEKEHSITKRLVELKKKKSTEYSSDILGRIENEIKQLKEERKKLVDGLRKATLDDCDERCTQYAAVHYPEPFDLSQIKMEPDEVIIEYAVTEMATYAWLIRDHQVKMQIKIDIPITDLEKLITDYKKYLTDYKSKDEKMMIISHWLYRSLIGNFIPLIDENRDRIIIIPDKQLGLIPFETLMISYSEENPFVEEKHPDRSIYYFRPNAEYFGDKYHIAYFQSAGAMSQSRMLSYKAAAPKTILSVADPTFKPSRPRLENIEKLMGGFSPLPETRSLVQSLKQKQSFNRKASRFLTGPDANEAVLKQTLTSNHFDLIVIATHGILKSGLPTLIEPALILSQTSPSEEDDILEMSDVMNLTLYTKLVALIACISGVGELVSGEGVMNLGRAFLYAGAQSVMMSLWDVPVDSSVLLADSFLSYLLEGNDNTQAIRLARADVRAAGYDHPLFWAPFVLYGQN